MMWPMSWSGALPEFDARLYQFENGIRRGLQLLRPTSRRPDHSPSLDCPIKPKI